MANNITNLMVTNFEGNMILGAQNLESRLTDCVMVDSGQEGDLLQSFLQLKQRKLLLEEVILFYQM